MVEGLNDKTIIYKHKIDEIENRKLGIFDVDWTLIKPKEGRTFPKDKNDWMWLRKSVPETIREYSKKYQIVFLTDQSKNWKVEMIKELCNILDIPIIVLISMDKEYNKPNKTLFKSVFRKKYSKKRSFYVGDAAGRKDDWSSCDKEIAAKIKVKFYTPEDIFEMDEIEENKEEYEKEEKEVIMMVGMQGSGKSTFAKNKFQNYTIISGDIYKTAERMIKEANKYDTSIVFDSTNGTKEKRKYFIEYAKSKDLEVRCFWVDRSIDICIEQNKQREKEKDIHIPKIALYKYRKDFEEPDESEGFKLIKI